MIEENLHNETEIRRFLLGEMSEDERSAFEEKFVADESLFEQVRVVEDKLIESYVRAGLSSAEREKFERNFLSTEPRRRRVAFTRTMLDKLADQKEIVIAGQVETSAETPSIWRSFASFFKTPKLAFGAAFALLFVAFGVWFLVLNSRENKIEVVRQTTPTPTLEIVEPVQNQSLPPQQNAAVNSNTNAAEKSPANKAASPNTDKEPQNKNQNPDARKPNSAGTLPVLALFSGTIRAEGKMPQLNLPKNASGANLQLNLESQDYKIYRVEIVDPDGNLIVQNNKLKAKNSKINLFVSAKKLRRGDYMVKLSALNPQNENESVADYSFRVNHK